MTKISSFLFALLLAPAAWANEVGDEVEVTAGAVTAISCAQEAQRTKDLGLLTSCPMAEAQKEIVVFDVAERQIYRISKKVVRRFELEKAFGGGSIDFTGIVKSVDKKSGVITVEVSEYSVTAKPKAGSFKGCL